MSALSVFLSNKTDTDWPFRYIVQGIGRPSRDLEQQGMVSLVPLSRCVDVSHLLDDTLL